MTTYLWTSTTKYVDIDTGESISETKAKQHYIIIKTDKHVMVNDTLQKGHIEYTKQCRRQPQLEINFPNH